MRRTKTRPGDLRFALVHDWLTVPAGSEAVFAEMCSLYPGVVFSSQIDADRNEFLQKLERRPSWVQHMPFALTKHQIYAPVLPFVYSHMDLSEFDIILSDSHSFAHGVRRRPDALHINYYHTPARSLWVPEIDPRASKTFLHRMIAARLRKLDLEASKRPDILFANSETTAGRVQKFYGRKVSKVIYPPVHTTTWLDVEKVDDSAGFLCWGRLIEYKRVDLAIEAARETGMKLNIVGSGPAEEKLRELAQGLPDVRFWGRLPDDKLRDLISKSRALIFPGYEDFGIVPVEAMAAGLPVVAFGEGGVTESVGEQQGILFQDQTVKSLVEALQRLATKRFEISALKERARQFDVEVFRREYKSAVDAAIEGHVSDAA